MAISKLGGTSKWVEIASNSPTSGRLISFTGISEIYSDLLISWDNVGSSSQSSVTDVLFNNNSTGNNYAYNKIINAGDVYYSTTIRNTASANEFRGPQLRTDSESSGYLLIQGANQPFKLIEGEMMNQALADYETNVKGTWFDTASINRIDVNLNNTSASYRTGTIKIFGRV